MLIYLPFTSYLTGCIVVLAIYYAVVWLLYFVKKPQAAIQPPIANQPIPAIQQKDDNELSPQVFDFTDELNALLVQSAAQKEDKETVSSYITNLLHKYPSLKNSSFHPPITSLIKQEAADKCSVEFDTTELNAMW